LLRLLKVIIRLLLNNFNSKGNYSNLLIRFKGVNNKGINKKDVYFNVINAFNSFNVLKF
jgi:predicted AAA+ superfamily ATPase